MLSIKNMRIAKRHIQKNFPNLNDKLFKVVKSIDLENLNLEKGNFFVVKEAPGHRKGEKVFTTIPNGNYRPITYIKDKEARAKLSKVAEVLAIPYVQSMHGFIKSRNCFTAVQPHLNGKAVLCVDLKDAFNQITRDQVYYVFKHVLDLNKRDSHTLTEAATYKGKLYQGCPYSPQIFNILSIHAHLSLNGIKGLTFTAYADDFNFTADYPMFSHKFKKFLVRIIEECGLKVNQGKTKFFSNHETWSVLGYTIYKGKRIAIRNRQKFFKRFKRLWYSLEVRHKEKENHGSELTERGVTLVALKSGLNAWLQNVNPEQQRRAMETNKNEIRFRIPFRELVYNLA